MRTLSQILLALIIATSAFAAEPVIVLADVDRGLALIPEGTQLPKGVRVYVRRVKEGSTKSLGVRHRDLGQELQFVPAPAARFEEARQAIARSKRPEKIETADVNESVYVYFYDGSYHQAQWAMYDLIDHRNNLASTTAYTPGGDWYQGNATVSQWSEGTSVFNSSGFCWIGASGGDCSTSNGSFGFIYATVHSEATIRHYYPQPCGRWGEPPCTEVFESTITYQFPY